MLVRAGETVLSMNGPKVSTPQRPNTTLGTPASSSRRRPTPPWAHLGTHSVSISTAPTAIGTARPMAIAEVTRVPSISGRKP